MSLQELILKMKTESKPEIQKLAECAEVLRSVLEIHRGEYLTDMAFKRVEEICRMSSVREPVLYKQSK